jgi:hypothetical protein
VAFGEDQNAIDPDKKLALGKIESIIDCHNKNRKLLMRGITKSALKVKLIKRLNSNDSLYDGLFLVGDKAKNFLLKSVNVTNPIRHINSTDLNVANWIFDCYVEMDKGPIDLDYFKNPANKSTFCNALTGNQGIIDYYLFGLHTADSDNLVNFVSTTLSPKTALYYDVDKFDKLVFFLWLPENFTLYINAEKLRAYERQITEKKLPILKDSFYPKEEEFSIKGFIPPHLILCVHDIDANKVFLNPALLVEKPDWIEDGLDVNQARFSDFIKTTSYLRFLMLTSGDQLEETDIFSED